MRPGFLRQPGAASDPADDPPGAMPVQPPPVSGQEERAITSFCDGQVDRSGGAGRERDGDHLAGLASDDQGPVPALQAQVLDVRAGRFGDAQPIQDEKRDQRVLTRRAEARGNQERTELVAVQADRVRLVIQARTADTRRPRNARAVLPRPRTGRTRRWCTAGG